MEPYEEGPTMYYCTELTNYRYVHLMLEFTPAEAACNFSVPATAETRAG